MDGHRFDDLTRALAGARSRRSALRAALAGTLAAVAGSGAALRAQAQAVVGGSRRLGEACASTSECSQSGGSVVCASNGLAEDGAKNCCRNSGGACGSDLQCCAGYYCINGVCGGSGSGTSSGSTSGSTSAGSGSKAPGAACTATAECSQAGGAIVCGDNGIATDGPLNCCRNEGGRCSDSVYSADCCGGLYCRDGYCKGLATDGTRSPGEACTETAQCDQVYEVTYCADNGLSDDGPLNCCRYEGGSCSTDRGCCAGFLCIGGICGGTGSGTAAESGGDEAISGGGSGYVAIGGACTYDEECSQEGAPSVCRDNGLPGDGGYNCCRYGGHACGSDSHCCAGYLCLGGVCSGG